MPIGHLADATSLALGYTQQYPFVNSAPCEVQMGREPLVPLEHNPVAGRHTSLRRHRRWSPNAK
ncbi:hypothetical protein NITHO_1770003 [Nitrolancea hollandica Lb]|uniref:Uncharacterized protein n=1 Tax=Nitrolancea hollandica Lb TaxID=1129897 RepID=I4EEA5_9BACT|nr:hypothetical protein NITHO_1770003 [Nitrolancea hollandica Lb]